MEDKERSEQWLVNKEARLGKNMQISKLINMADQMVVFVNENVENNLRKGIYKPW